MKKVESTPYALLALFIGGLGIHKFYAGYNNKGILYLVFFWTGVPGIIAFFTGINALMNSKNGKVTLDADSRIVTK